MDKSRNYIQCILMKTNERQQIRLILENSFDISTQSLIDNIKKIQANASATGTLTSGDTLKKYALVYKQEGEKFIYSTLDEISNVAMDFESFQMFSEQFEIFNNQVRRRFEDDRIILHLTKSRSSSAGLAFWKIFDEVTIRLIRQKDIRAFAYTKPSTSKVAEIQAKVGLSESVSPIKNIHVPEKLNSGRLPADWWDNLWVEICRQIYLGELIPKSQADIVKAMHDYLAGQNIEVSDSTLKPRARKLFVMLENANRD